MKESTKKEEGTVIAAAKFTDNKRRESHIKRRDMEEGAKSHSWRRSRSNKGVAYWILATTSKTHRKTLQDNRIWSLKCSRWLRKYCSLYAVNELTAEREKLKKTEIVIKSRSSVCRIYRFFLKIFFAKYSYLPCNVLITNAMNNSCNQFLFHSVLLLYMFRTNLVVHHQENGIIYCITQFGTIVQTSLELPPQLYWLYCVIQYIIPCSWWWTARFVRNMQSRQKL